MNSELREQLSDCKRLIAGHRHTIDSYSGRRTQILEEIEKLQKDLAFLDRARESAPEALKRLERERDRLEQLCKESPLSGPRVLTPREKLDRKAAKLRELMGEIPPELIQQILSEMGD